MRRVVSIYIFRITHPVSSRLFQNELFPSNMSTDTKSDLVQNATRGRFQNIPRATISLHQTLQLWGFSKQIHLFQVVPSQITDFLDRGGQQGPCSTPTSLLTFKWMEWNGSAGRDRQKTIQFHQPDPLWLQIKRVKNALHSLLYLYLLYLFYLYFYIIIYYYLRE